LRSADVVVAQHAGQQRLLTGRGIPSEIIHSSLDLSRTKPAVERSIDCLWVARCEPWKRPELLIELARSLPNRNVVMICPPSKDQEQLFEQISSKARKLANLTFIERVSFAESQKYFERAKVFIGTSQAEGFPNTYVQACAAGTPIVAYEVDPEEFIEHNRAGLVARGNFRSLTQAVESLLTDPDEWKQCSENARAYADRTHDLNAQGARWATLLRSVAPTSPAVTRHVVEEREHS
jgi:glycosyltransferase involved in cell wall biosynthesis